MFCIENSVPKTGTIRLSVETARLDNFAKEFDNAVSLFGNDMFRHLCFDEPVIAHIVELKNVVANLGKTYDAKKKKNMVGYIYVCLEELSYMLFKLSETLSSSIGLMNTSKFYEYVRLALAYRESEYKLVESGKNLKEIAHALQEKRDAVEIARREMEEAIIH